MILKSKLGNSYPVADPKVYLIGDTDGLDPVFAGRLAYIAKITNTKIKITDGYRPYDEQVKMYDMYKAGKLKATAAIPGTSWHGSRLAVDTSTQPIRGMTNADLKKYGLCKPLSKEGWHIQPIETASMGAKCNTSLSPIDLSAQLKAKFNLQDSELKRIEGYEYSLQLADGLLAGKKSFSQGTLDYLGDLKTKFGL